VFAVNAFTRFTRSPTFVEGVAPRLIERMQERFKAEPGAVTADFLGRCGVESPDVSGIVPERLGEALAWLAICDQRSSLKMLSCPVQALSGTNDQVVPATMSRAAFAEVELVLAEGGGHLLPLTHPDWVASKLRMFAARLG
jgi:pimeloyl-[acyl-carrier protein] methyl ester esterase